MEKEKMTLLARIQRNKKNFDKLSRDKQKQVTRDLIKAQKHIDAINFGIDNGLNIDAKDFFNNFGNYQLSFNSLFVAYRQSYVDGQFRFAIRYFEMSSFQRIMLRVSSFVYPKGASMI